MGLFPRWTPPGLWDDLPEAAVDERWETCPVSGQADAGFVDQVDAKELSMAYAIDLSERQTSRTFQQAIRHQASVRLFPRLWEEERCMLCRVASAELHEQHESSVLVLEAPTESFLPFRQAEEWDGELTDADTHRPVEQKDFEELCRAYCDAQLMLGENRYLFCSDVVFVAPDEEGHLWRIGLYRPSEIQIMQRRRYWRFRPARSSRVEMRWRDEQGHRGVAIGWLCNISPDGIAVRTDEQFSDRLFIGTHLNTTFKLDPTTNDSYNVECVICNKMPAGTKGKVVLGMQFTSDTPDAPQAEIERIRQQLIKSDLVRHRPASKGAES